MRQIGGRMRRLRIVAQTTAVTCDQMMQHHWNIDEHHNTRTTQDWDTFDLRRFISPVAYFICGGRIKCTPLYYTTLRTEYSASTLFQ